MEHSKYDKAMSQISKMNFHYTIFGSALIFSLCLRSLKVYAFIYALCLWLFILSKIKWIAKK